MGDGGGVWGILAVILTALIASGGTLVASRWANRNERIRLRQEMVAIGGTERQMLAEEAQKARARANEVDEELEKVRDERRALADQFAEFKISTREAAAEKESTHRAALLEREALHRRAMDAAEANKRELALQLQRVEGQLDECNREISRVRAEGERMSDLVRAQAVVIAEYRARHPEPGSSTQRRMES